MRTKKQKRKLRKKKKELKAKHRKYAKKEKHKPWEPVKMSFFEIPSPFPKDLSVSQRKEIIKSIGKKARESFSKNFPLIERWFKEYDPLYLLSFFASYFLTSPEGIDKEALGEQEFFPFHLEILQAFALIDVRHYSVQPLLEKTSQFVDEMNEIGQAMQFRYFDMVGEIEDEANIHKHKLRFDIIAATTAIRNWAYYYQMERVTSDLAILIKDRFYEKYNLESEKIIKTLFALCSLVEEKLNEHRHKVRKIFSKNTHAEIINLYNQAFPENLSIQGKDINSIWEMANKDIKNLRTMLIWHSDLKLENIYTFTLEEIVDIYGDKTKTKELQCLLDKWSLSFGDLKDQDKEHIILDNPTHHKPFIKIDESKYFTSIIGILPHLSISLLEEIIFEDTIWKEEYTGVIKPKYLEQEVERLCTNYFPNASIFRGSLWESPYDNKIYENDLCVILDNFAIVIESKSGLMTPPAKRGAPKSLAENLKKLVIEPAIQANRFIDFLENNKNLHEFKTKRDVVNKIDSSLIDYFIPLSITLEEIGAIASNLKKLIDADLVNKKINELAPSMCLTDFETVLDILSSESERIHYLARRREFESNVIYEGDELDLLAFYLDNGFNIGDKEFDENFHILLITKSKELDPYYVAKGENINIRKPERTMTKWWRDLLDYIDKRKKKNWVVNSFILLSTTFEDQKEFESRFNEMKKLIKKGKAPHKYNWVIFLSGPQKRRHLITGFPYTETDKKSRDDMMYTIMSSDYARGTLGTLCIGQNINSNEYPYSVLGCRINNKLFII